LGYKDEINTIRATITLIFAVVPLVLLTLGFVFHKCEAPCPLGLILVICNLAVMVVIVVMTAHFAVGVVQGDLCTELSRTDGLVALLKQEAGLGFEGIDSVAGSAVPTVIDDICSEFAQLCNYPGQSCDPSSGCTENTINNIVNQSTIYDNGTAVPVTECAQICSSSDLKNRAQSILNLRDDFLLLIDIIDQIYNLLSGIISGTTITGFVKDFCGLVGNALTLMYVGCAFLAVSLVAGVPLLIWLSWYM